MKYRGIETRNEFVNGNWITYFSKDGELIKTVEWKGAFGDGDIKKVINTQILRFM